MVKLGSCSVHEIITSTSCHALDKICCQNSFCLGYERRLGMHCFMAGELLPQTWHLVHTAVELTVSKECSNVLFTLESHKTEIVGR